MIHRGLDENGDFLFGKGKSDYTKNLSAILLNVKTRLKSWKYDSFYSPNEGVDYNNYLDIGTKSFLDADIKRVILQSEGIIKILSYSSELDRDNRDFTAEVKLLTIYGATKVVI